MKARVEKPNWFALQRRAEKAERLVSAAHKMRKRLGISETAMLESVAHWPPLWCAQLAVLAGTKPPSDTTKDAVLATLAKSALVERMAEEHRVPTLDHERDNRESV